VAAASRLLAVILIVAGCGAQVPSATGIDLERARDQARTFRTLATPDQWGNYGEQFTAFCQAKFGFDCNRDDRDVGADLSSAEEVQQWVAERNNPQSVLADIGIAYIGQAEQQGILADYEPPNADLLPDELHGPGWVATFVGVPTILVNVDALEARGLPVPESWADLADPAYAGLVGSRRIGISAPATWAFVAMNLAAGGTLEDWQPGVEYGRRLLPNLTAAASPETFERGEVPINVTFDFFQSAWVADIAAKGVDVRHIVPRDGSVYGPSTLMMNRYDTAHHDFAKLFMEWVLTDEGQRLFARYGARPIRSVVGESLLDVPDEYRVNWLPDAEYERVRTIDWRQVDPNVILDIWETQVVGGG
jgi:putative spermidine/putrescine transport system substrate-binding protein